MFKNAKWIWTNTAPSEDEYGEFYTSFDYSEGSLLLNISADSNYAVYLNGKLAAFGQYADFPYDKIYDEIDIADLAVKGKNHLAIIVWYYGIDTTQVYCKGNASLLFEVFRNEESVVSSDNSTLCRKSVTYKNHYCKSITPQLGLSYFYDATKEDNWTCGELLGFSSACEILQNSPLRKRPCKRLVAAPIRIGTEIKRIAENDLLFDLGTNEVGFFSIDVESEEEQTLTIAYGEHIVDGCVRRNIWIRDFSVEIKLKKGRTVYTNPFRRLGAKYLEVFSEKPVRINTIGLVPTMYPLSEGKKPVLTKSEEEIYDICVRTLRLCMHEHYEDCPWREQALYCMDSRNQMLLGYYAFNEFEFPRANLQLISKDNLDHGLLAICFPMNAGLVIPSFSLHYFAQCLDYFKYSGDKTLLEEVYPKLSALIKVFTDKMENEGDIILPFSEHWNFYEWSKGLAGHGGYNGNIADLPLNALLSLALQDMDEIRRILGKETHYKEISDKLNKAIHKNFFDPENGLYFDQADTKRFSKLSNSLAVLCGAADANLAKDICEKLINDDGLTEITLSMQTFFFNALIKCDKDKYGEYILNLIEKKYRPMVDMGIGTVWETELGEADFENAGSLCHGWSAVPIYYYHILKK